MKQYLSIAVICLFIFGCNTTDKGFTINGNAEGVHDGVRVYLKTLDTKTGREIVKDTAIVFDEQFKIQGNVDYPELQYITVNSVTGMLPILLENNKIEVTIDKDNISESTITGSESQKDFDAFLEGMMEIQKKGFEVITELRSTRKSQNPAKFDSLSAIMLDYEKEAKAYPIQYIKNNEDSYFSLIILDQETNKQKIDIKDYKYAFDNLDASIKNSPKGSAVSKKIDSLYKEYEKLAHLEIGNKAPNFEAPNTEGKTVSLDELKGKVTIIDFWAAWCAPCRRENPNVVRIYERFHDDGLEIIGVSLDGTPRQKNPKQAWLDAIEKDNLTWHQVSSLNYFNDPVAKLYNITAIPATYILDENGIIVAKNLRGAALENKVKELLNK